MLFATTDLQILKEATDRRSMNGGVSDALTGWFEGRGQISVLDLSAGTGANVRLLAPLLAPDQSWTLYTRDATEEATARDHITRWAPAFRDIEGGIELDRAGQRIAIAFVRHDPVAAGGSLAGPPSMLTVIGDDVLRYPATAIRRLAATLAGARSVVLARGVYDGRLKLQPHHAADSAMTAALHRELMHDAGHGAVCGPLAANELAEQLRLAEATVIEGPSALHLRQAEAPLIRAVQRRMADAQRVVAKGHDKMIDAWLARPRTSLEVSQTDLIGLPG